MKKYIVLSILALSMGLVSCNDFLDTLPDNRTEANSVEKIQKLLVAAYPTHDHMAFTEYASDNVDEVLSNSSYKERFIDQCYTWTDITETNNQDPRGYWMDLYQCIETAHMALEGIESMGGATTATLKEMQAEALVCRAYAHFMLVNLFATHYDSGNPNAIGVSFVSATEKELNPQYQRETVQENYAHIAADLEAALPYVGDSYYDVPKYHFNKNAAYAFATRFYLYYEKYDKAIECANMVLGTNPKAMLRDWDVLNTMPNGAVYQQDPYANHVIEPTLNCNLLLLTSYSNQPIYFGGWSTGKAYTHNSYLGTTETLSALAGLWGGNYSSFAVPPKRYTARNYWSMWRLPYLFEETDNLGNGYRHTVYNAFTGDEVLLNRAEAYIMLKQFDKACEDLTLWIDNVSRAKTYVLTPQKAETYIKSLNYAYDKKNADGSVEHKASVEGSLKKHLNPKFAIDAEGSTQECLIQLVLACRRYETLHEGKRWFDIKRWGIEIPRRTIDAAGNPVEFTDWLTVDDKRRAIQIPQDVVSAGYEPNPRDEKKPGDSDIDICEKE